VVELLISFLEPQTVASAPNGATLVVCNDVGSKLIGGIQFLFSNPNTVLAVRRFVVRAREAGFVVCAFRFRMGCSPRRHTPSN
jgi:hypothetical protein